MNDYDYLTSDQTSKLLEPINGGRVHRDDKGFSHVQAYEIRAHLNRLFGFTRWSCETVEYRQLFEMEKPKLDKNGNPRIKDGYPIIGYTVGYSATVRLTICAPDGTKLATYTEAAVGVGQNLPDRGDSHDMGLKTAESQALKRCAANLGDQFGLSLYKGGSLKPIVWRTLVGGPPSAGDGRVTAGVDLQSAGVEAPAGPEAGGLASIRTQANDDEPNAGWPPMDSEGL